MPVTRAALDTASRAALRAILAVRPDVAAVDSPAPVTEPYAASDPPVLSTPEFLEPAAAVHQVGTAAVGFSAFLDGTQTARIVAWGEGVPFVFGSCGAVVRERRDRLLHTWGQPLLENRVYLPCSYAHGFEAPHAGLRVVDTTAPGLGALPSRHPAALLERALNCLQRDRERLEQRLAEAWTSSPSGNLCLDGPLPASGSGRTAPNLIGVVKSHRTLYADGMGLQKVLALRTGERSAVFRIAAGGRSAVASWYLRTRDPRGHDALWGLIRVESVIVDDHAARADEVSRWILAENAPLALPDTRWDKMSYGVRSCEAFLRAVS